MLLKSLALALGKASFPACLRAGGCAEHPRAVPRSGSVPLRWGAPDGGRRKLAVGSGETLCLLLLLARREEVMIY